MAKQSYTEASRERGEAVPHSELLPGAVAVLKLKEKMPFVSLRCYK